jgi:hypothetical protein
MRPYATTRRSHSLFVLATGCEPLRFLTMRRRTLSQLSCFFPPRGCRNGERRSPGPFRILDSSNRSRFLFKLQRVILNPFGLPVIVLRNLQDILFRSLLLRHSLVGRIGRSHRLALGFD